MRIDNWDDWYSLEAVAREFDEFLREDSPAETPVPQAVNIGLWLPSNAVQEVSQELTRLDIDMRKGSSLLPSRFYAPRVFPFAPLLNLPEPVNTLDGRLEVAAARQEGSLQIDLYAVGLLIGLLVDTPNLFFMLRAATHRFPFRIRLERREDVEDESPQYSEPIEGSFSARQAEEIEAQRIRRRMTVDHPSGSRLIVEEFE